MHPDKSVENIDDGEGCRKLTEGSGSVLRETYLAGSGLHEISLEQYRVSPCTLVLNKKVTK